MAITRTEAQQLHLEVDEAIQVIAKRHGLSCSSGRARFDSTQFSVQVEFKTAMALQQESEALNLPLDVIGRIFELHGVSYKIIRLEPSRPKFPIVAERMTDGKKFKFQRGVAAQSQ